MNPLDLARGAGVQSPPKSRTERTYDCASVHTRAAMAFKKMNLKKYKSGQVKSYSPGVQKAGAGKKSITSAVLFSAGDVCVSRPGFCDLRRVG